MHNTKINEQLNNGPKGRSGFERDVMRSLNVRGVPFGYEPIALDYVINHTYTPDFILPNGIIIEAKGFFDSKDRTKHLAVREQHPDLDIRFLFQNANTRFSPKSKTTYGQWASKKGFLWAHGVVIPDAWINE